MGQVRVHVYLRNQPGTTDFAGSQPLTRLATVEGLERVLVGLHTKDSAKAKGCVGDLRLLRRNGAIQVSREAAEAGKEITVLEEEFGSVSCVVCARGIQIGHPRCGAHGEIVRSYTAMGSSSPLQAMHRSRSA